MREESVEQTKEEYLNLNATQLADGKDKFNDYIRLDGDARYHPLTIELKQENGVGLGAITDRITLYQTGKMYETMDLDVTSDEAQPIFTTDYAEDVLARTGPDVLGLDEENISEYSNGAFAEAIKPKITEVLKLEFI